MASGDILVHKSNGTTYDEVPAAQATSAQMVTGTSNEVLATPKNVKDAEFIPIHVGTTAPSDTTILWLDTN